MKRVPFASLLFAGLLLNLTACQKEQFDLPDTPTPIDTTVVSPIDTTSVTPIDTTNVDTTHAGPQYLPASAMAADTGAYGRIDHTNESYGSNLHYYYWEQRLRIQNDTLYFGNWCLLPTTYQVAYIRPAAGTFAVTHYNGMGYAYNEHLPCTTDGYLTVEENGLRIEYYHHLNAGGIRYTSQFWHSTRNSAPLTRTDYLGTFSGAITDASGFGLATTLHIEADSTTNGVWLPEIQRRGFVNETGELVLPEAPVEPNNPAVFSTATTTLRGQVLVFGVQALDYPGATPIAGGYKRYLFVKN